MKFKSTRKEILNGYRDVISVSYCSLQRLLQHETAIAYTTRAEGWAADIYQFGNTAIVTGYAPFGNIRPCYETNARYDSTAEKINNQLQDYDTKKRELYKLILEYIKEVTQ